MSVSRRSFLKYASLAASAALTGVAPARAVAQKSATGKSLPRSVSDYEIDRLYTFTPETFSPYLNTEFRFKRAGGKSVTTVLVEVRDLRPPSGKDAAANDAAAASAGQCFALVFRGARSKPLASEQYRVTHGALGSFALFISPVGSGDATASYYEAVVNHRLP